MEVNNLVSYLSGGKNVQTYYGLDGYVMPMLLRIDTKPEVIKQIINAEQVAKFHEKTDDFVRKFISKRVGLGIKIQNLIRPEDTKFEIELSDPKTLKETKILPADFGISSMLAVFGDYVTFSNLDEKECMGVVIRDPAISTMVSSMFDGLWKIGKKV